MTFWTKLEESVAQRNSLLCVGLDPVPERIPSRYGSITDFSRAIIDATSEFACIFKPNIAFYEALGAEGMQALRETIRYVPDDVPVLLDAKRNDIGSTAEAYARAVYDELGADAVTVNPYLGRDGVDPFLAYEDRGVFVLCKTSNASAGEIQDWAQGGQPLFRRVAELADEWGGGRDMGLVIGATYPEAIADIRAQSSTTWFLVPGVGAQGGDLEAVLAAGLRGDGLGVLINSSRGVIYAEDPREAARNLKERINAARRQAASSSPVKSADAELTRLSVALYDAGLIKFGDFMLKSGDHSPVYVDLRPLVSSPRLLEQVAAAYVPLLRGLEFERIAAIPYTALPIGTAVSLRTGRALIYPRRETKGYGTRRRIEGDFATGERAAVFDDLITTGGSKIEAIEPLEEAGLEVQDVVVLIDREQGGGEELARRGYRLHSLLTLRRVVDDLVRVGRLSSADGRSVHSYLDAEG